MRFILGIVCFVLATTAQAQAVHVTGQSPWPLKLTGHAQILEDHSGRRTFDDVATLPLGATGGFRLLDRNTHSPGYSRSAWWLRFAVSNDGTQALPLRFLLGTPGFQRLDFYVQQRNKWTHIRAGEEVPPIQREQISRLPSLAFTLDPKTTARVLVRIQSGKAIHLKPKLYTQKAYEGREDKWLLWDGVLFGGLLALGWGALLVALFSRSFPLSILGVLSIVTALYEASARGYTQIFLWPQAGDWGYRCTAVFGYTALALFLVFARSLAKAENIALPWPRFFSVFAIVEIIMALNAWFGDLSAVIQISDYTNLLVASGLVGVAILFLRRNLPSRRLILLTTLFFLFQISLRAIQRSGHLPEFITSIGIHDVSTNPIIALLGLAINLAIFAAWVNYVAQQRKTAGNVLIAWQKREQDKLKEEVAKQTHALNQALQYADDKNRQKTEMLGYISHDLRAPLATILGYIKILTGMQTPRQAPYMQAIGRSANYQLTLIDDLLEYAKGEMQPLQIHPVAVHLPSFIKNVVQHAHVLSAQQNNQFICEATGPLPEIALLDERRLQQVLLNLLSNAAKFTQRGTIKLVINADRTPEEWRLRFAVADSGIGIDMASQSNVFNAFTQLHATQGGAGLGLFIAQSIVKSMGGVLKLDSKPSVGSTLSFEIKVQSVGNKLGTIEQTEPRDDDKAKSPINSGDAVDFHVPPASDRLELATLARDGRLTEIENWIERVSKSDPLYTEFLKRIKAALQVLNLEQIEKLALSPTSSA